MSSLVTYARKWHMRKWKMALRKLERRNHDGKWAMSIKYQYLHSFKEGLILLCRSILETRRITHLHGSAHFTIPLTTLSSSKIFERVLKTSLIPIQSWQQQNNTHGHCCYLHCWLWLGKCPLDLAGKKPFIFLAIHNNFQTWSQDSRKYLRWSTLQ